jgi:peptide/nickel transport system substrate-binding protein
VRWQNLPPVNGRELVADDVAWTLNYYLQNSTVASKYTSVIDNWTVPDKYTIVVQLKVPFAGFLTATLAQDFVILPHEIQEQYGNFVDIAVGTGPWVLDRWDHGSLMTFKPNPDYWRIGADGKPLPYASAYKYFTYQDQAGVTAAIRANQIDYYTTSLGGLDLPTVNSMKKDRPDLIYVDCQLANLIFIAFNQKRTPWDDVRVRRAIALGIDKDEVLATALNNDTNRSGFIPQVLSDWAWPADRVKSMFGFDRAAAQQQLQALGVAGAPLELSQNSTGDESLNSAQVVASQLTDLGFQVTITMPSSVPSGLATLAGGKFDLSVYVGSTSFEVDDWLTRYWSSSGPLNVWGYNNPAFDAFALQQRRELDPVKRKALIDQAQDVLYQDMAGVPIAGRQNIHKVINPRLKNVRVPHYVADTLTSIWIDA